MGAGNTKTYQADFRFELLNGNLTWSASGGNWPWDVPFQPYLDGGVFRIWRPFHTSGSTVSYRLNSSPSSVNNFYPAIQSEGIFDILVFQEFRLSAEPKVVNIGDIIHNGSLEPNGSRVIIVSYTAIEQLKGASSVPQAINFGYNFIEGTYAPSNDNVRVDDDTILSYNNKEIATADNNLAGVVIGNIANISNNDGFFRLLIMISNVEGNLNITYNNQYAPEVTSVTTNGSEIRINLSQGIAAHKLGHLTNITTSDIVVPDDLKFSATYYSDYIILSPNIVGGNIITMIKPGTELGISVLLIAFS